MAVRYDQEIKDRVIRMFEERRTEAPEESQAASYRRLHDLTGIPIDPMRGWVARAHIDAGERPRVLGDCYLFLSAQTRFIVMA